MFYNDIQIILEVSKVFTSKTSIKSFLMNSAPLFMSKIPKVQLCIHLNF